MYCYIRDAPRLACVKPVASVHPEPGSNSSLLYLLFLCSVFITDIPFIGTEDLPASSDALIYRVVELTIYLALVLRTVCTVLSMFSVFSPQPVFKPKAVAKLLPFFELTKFFQKKIKKFLFFPFFPLLTRLFFVTIP